MSMNAVSYVQNELNEAVNNFLKNTEGYAIQIYIKSNGFIIESFLIRSDDCLYTQYDNKPSELSISILDGINDIRHQIIYFPREQVIGCIDEIDRWGSKTVHVLMKNDMMIELECCGMRA